MATNTKKSQTKIKILIAKKMRETYGVNIYSEDFKKIGSSSTDEKANPYDVYAYFRPESDSIYYGIYYPKTDTIKINFLIGIKHKA